LNSISAEYISGVVRSVKIDNVIPPKDGIAIGTMMSEPRPVDVRTGINANTVVAVVIRHGLTRRKAASMVAR